MVREAAAIQYGERGRAALPTRRRKARRYLAQNLTKCAERSVDLDFDVLFGEHDRVVVPVHVIVAMDAELVAFGGDPSQHLGERAGNFGSGQQRAVEGGA